MSEMNFGNESNIHNELELSLLTVSDAFEDNQNNVSLSMG